MSEIELEGEWLVSLDEGAKVAFLSLLGHTLTIAGRNSYAVQGEGLDKPDQLRKINEIQHRVLACLREVLSGSVTVSFQRSIADWVLNQKDTEMHELMAWAWQSTKAHLP
jgi:hypothetical protein